MKYGYARILTGDQKQADLQIDRKSFCAENDNEYFRGCCHFVINDCNRRLIPQLSSLFYANWMINATTNAY